MVETHSKSLIWWPIYRSLICFIFPSPCSLVLYYFDHHQTSDHKNVGLPRVEIGPQLSAYISTSSLSHHIFCWTGIKTVQLSLQTPNTHPWSEEKLHRVPLLHMPGIVAQVIPLTATVLSEKSHSDLFSFSLVCLDTITPYHSILVNVTRRTSTLSRRGASAGVLGSLNEACGQTRRVSFRYVLISACSQFNRPPGEWESQLWKRSASSRFWSLSQYHLWSLLGLR